MQTLSITRNGADSLTIQGTTVSRFLVNFALGAGTLATKTMYNAVITVQLNRDGEAGQTILSTGLDVAPYVTGVSTAENMQFDATHFGYVVDLPCPINLQGNDRLNVRFQAGSCFQTSAPAEIDYTATLTVCTGVGIEKWTPVLKVFQVPSGQTNFSQSFGDFVRHIALIQPVNKVTQVQIESRFYNEQLIKEDLQCILLDQYAYSKGSSALLQPATGNVNLYGVSQNLQFPLQGVRVMGTVDTGVSGNVYIAVWSGDTCNTVKARSLALKSRIANETSQVIPSM